MLFKKKKIHELKYVMLQEGLPNFLNDTCIKIVVDENEKIIKFIDERKNGATADLSINKITSVQTGTRDKIINRNGTGAAIVGGIVAGTTGAIIGASTGNKSAQLLTLTITYKSNDTENKIILYQTNYGNAATIQLLKALLDKNMLPSSPTHINL